MQGSINRLKGIFVPPNQKQDLTQVSLQLEWIVRIRFLAILLLALAIPFALALGSLTSESLNFYFSQLVILATFNFLTKTLWLKSRRPPPRHLILFQLLVDLGLLSGLLLLTGGSANPFYLLFFLSAFLGALFLSKSEGFAFLGLSHGALLIVQVAPALDLLKEVSLVARVHGVTFLVHHLTLFLFWILSGSLRQILKDQSQRLSQLQVRSERMDRLKSIGALAAGFSHEFASPLNTIRLRVDRELKLNPYNKNLQDLEVALKDCETTLKVMNASQIDSRDFQFHSVRLSTLIENVITSWQSLHPGVDLEFRNLSGLEQKIDFPVLNFSQALMNLLDNAKEAAEKGKIQITLLKDDDFFYLQVQNNGSQFSDSVLERFGEPFLTTKPTGTGLGLYTVLLFSQSLGGSTRIQNKHGAACVEIQIPFRYEGLREEKNSDPGR